MDQMPDLVDRTIKLFEMIERALHEKRSYDVFILSSERSKVIDQLVNLGFNNNHKDFNQILEQTKIIGDNVQTLIKTYEEALRTEIQSANAKKAYGLSHALSSLHTGD